MSVLKDKAIKDKSRRPGHGGADSDGDQSKHGDHDHLARPTDREVVDEAGNEAEQAELEDGEDLEEEPMAEDACLEDPSTAHEESVPTQTTRGVNVD